MGSEAFQNKCKAHFGLVNTSLFNKQLPEPKLTDWLTTGPLGTNFSEIQI